MTRPSRGYRRFLLVRDDFYEDPGAVVRAARTMTYFEPDDAIGYRTSDVYYPKDTRRRLEKILGVPITNWNTDPEDGNGVFFLACAAGSKKEVPGVHYDEPVTDVSVVIYLTDGLPADCGTSFWRHRATGLADFPTASDARRLGKPKKQIHAILDADAKKRDRWIELDRAGYKYNRMVAFASGMFHSGTRHYGRGLGNGRIYQTFRIQVNWERSRIHS